ncbi:RagB/SusD family nutrient uptake outer membrane protein [Pseudobacter ginsenosidimutans]|uniref:Putative outer membrane starch-binding protein n=1 Tax=Pseudobacter ginsenosidimutans TaxID=661488 RepID=A0A4V2EZN7_9BACT|nr:RagB/SusD family nutrient uptake outer membrane protein [Pseudobacter ginsenosidimutans]QEC45582.1 RagB/SusD family nutrient uptake outer membrane protein [Pseudobacter ginsenosidimutans]RZS67130.1 putative outer membrane starch-binding protein [Pseudobacter ginsenosidimutans]
MKKIQLYTLLLVLILSGCTKTFLEVEDVTSVTEQNYYKTPEDAYKALVGCYDGLQQVWKDGIALPVAAEVMADNTFGGTGNSDGFGYQMMDEFDKLRSPADQNLFNPNWINYYHALYRCNMLLSKMDQIDWANSESLRPVYESEARFLRAYLYFDMTRLWGSVPLITVPTNENVPQASPDDIYKQIAEDLEFAAQNLPATKYTSQSPATYGRVTKWAAEALIGRVFLFYTGYYGKTDLAGVVTKAEATTWLVDVINNGGFGLVSNFADLWPAASVTTYAGEDNKETVFAIKYTFTSDYDGNTDGNHWLVMYGLRDQFSTPYGNGWGGGTVNPKLWNAYQATDTRREASIISIVDEEIDFKMKGNQREYTGYYVKKYTPTCDEDGNSIAVNKGGANFMVGQFQDYVSIRYADVLLMAAELGAASAQDYFDDVRRRAFKNAFSSIPASLENIQKERRLEFALEGHRFYDLLRQGVATAANTIAEVSTVQNGGVSTTKTITAAKINETKGLVQIPYTQITLSNGVLKQNNGW